MYQSFTSTLLPQKNMAVRRGSSQDFLRRPEIKPVITVPSGNLNAWRASPRENDLIRVSVHPLRMLSDVPWKKNSSFTSHNPSALPKAAPGIISVPLAPISKPSKPPRRSQSTNTRRRRRRRASERASERARPLSPRGNTQRIILG